MPKFSIPKAPNILGLYAYTKADDNEGSTPSKMVNVLFQFGINSHVVDKLSNDEIKAKIDKTGMVIAFENISGNYGHAFVIGGYSKGKEHLIYKTLDPSRGEVSAIIDGENITRANEKDKKIINYIIF